MSDKKKKMSFEEEGEEELQKRLKKEEELFEDLFGISIEEASEKDIIETLHNLNKIEKDMEINEKKEASKIMTQKIERIKVKSKIETLFKPMGEKQSKLEEKFTEGTPGTLKVVSIPSKTDTKIIPKKIQVITPKPLFKAPKIQAEEEIGELSELRCSMCGARIPKMDLQKINMGFIIPCKDCGGDLIGEAIKKD